MNDRLTRWRRGIRVCLTAAAVIIGGTAVISLMWPARSVEKITLLNSMEVVGTDGKGNPLLHWARFRFSTPRRGHWAARLSVQYLPSWEITVLTNNGTGPFVEGLEPEMVSFISPDGLDHLEFVVRDARLLNVNWKARVRRAGEYQFKPRFARNWPTVKAEQEVWVSAVIPPVRPKWKWESKSPPASVLPSPIPARPNEQPAFLTNVSPFAMPEFHYTR